MQEGVNVSLEERETLVSLGAVDARSRAWRTYFEASGRLQGVLESRMKAHFNMVQDGLVERLPSTIDGRGYDAVLTEKGLETVAAVTALHQRLVRDYLLAGLDDTQIEQLVEIMAALEEHMRYRTFSTNPALDLALDQ